MSEQAALVRHAPPPGHERGVPVDPLEGTPYRATGQLGRGGMGVVLCAEHRRLGNEVVVKVLHAHLAGSEDLVDRMRLEGRALAAVKDHPNVVQITDAGTTRDGRPFLVMERLLGRTLLAERRRRGRLPPVEAIALAQQVLAGLGAVHAAGIVHRDIKPANLFICDAAAGEPRVLKVLDFGVAKILSSAAAGAPLAARALATEQSALVGTPPYLAPEQAVGGELDARTDLYATGAVLFEMLTGRAPFDHHTETTDVLRAHLSEVPRPPSEIAGPSVSPELDRVVLRALAKRPGDRFQNAVAFAEELGRIALNLDRPEAANAGRTGRSTGSAGSLGNTGSTGRTAEERRSGSPLARPVALGVVWLASMGVTVGLGLLATEVFR